MKLSYFGNTQIFNIICTGIDCILLLECVKKTEIEYLQINVDFYTPNVTLADGANLLHMNSYLRHK